MSNPHKYKGSWNNNCPLSEERNYYFMIKVENYLIKIKVIPDYIISSPFLEQSKHRNYQKRS